MESPVMIYVFNVVVYHCHIPSLEELLHWSRHMPLVGWHERHRRSRRGPSSLEQHGRAAHGPGMDRCYGEGRGICRRYSARRFDSTWWKSGVIDIIDTDFEAGG